MTSMTEFSILRSIFSCVCSADNKEEEYTKAFVQTLLGNPVRIRPEPQDRNLAEEEQANAAHISYHQRRMEEEIAFVRKNYNSGRKHERARLCEECVLKGAFSLQREAYKIASITERRTQLMWTCPNDGVAYPFTWRGKQYYRTFRGEMWLRIPFRVSISPLYSLPWCGYWTGYYIAERPRDLAPLPPHLAQ